MNCFAVVVRAFPVVAPLSFGRGKVVGGRHKAGHDTRGKAGGDPRGKAGGDVGESADHDTGGKPAAICRAVCFPC